MSTVFKVALIGLDTSHTIEFARLMQGDAPPADRVEGLRAVGALRFPSAFQPEEGQDARQRQLEAWGIPVTRSLDEALAGAEGILLEINDPALHLAWFEKVVERGLPVFVDKPLAAGLAEGRRMVERAAARGVRMWSSSSLRFLEPLAAARAAVGTPEVAAVYGPLGRAAAGSDLVWYGVHAVEMLVALLGVGASRVWAHRGPAGAVLVVDYVDGRRGVVECVEGGWAYGGRAQRGATVVPFAAPPGANLYAGLMRRMRAFFLEGETPVPPAETLEVMAILDAGDRALAAGDWADC